MNGYSVKTYIQNKKTVANMVKKRSRHRLLRGGATKLESQAIIPTSVEGTVISHDGSRYKVKLRQTAPTISLNSARIELLAKDPRLKHVYFPFYNRDGKAVTCTSGDCFPESCYDIEGAWDMYYVGWSETVSGPIFRRLLCSDWTLVSRNPMGVTGGCT